MTRPYNIADLEDILHQIRTNLVKYKKEKHDLDVHALKDMIDDVVILRVQLSDIGADLAVSKLEAASKFDSDKARIEEEEEERLRALPKGQNTNAADRAKRKAKMEVSPSDMHIAYKMDKLAYNLYAISLEQWIFAMSSRLSMLRNPEANTKITTRALNHEGPDSFDELKETMAAERDLTGLESIIHE